MPRLVSVAVNVPALDPLTYRVPAELPAPPRGGRVLVPLGPRVVTGCVVATDVETDAGTSGRLSGRRSRSRRGSMFRSGTRSPDRSGGG